MKIESDEKMLEELWQNYLKADDLLTEAMESGDDEAVKNFKVAKDEALKRFCENEQKVQERYLEYEKTYLSDENEKKKIRNEWVNSAVGWGLTAIGIVLPLAFYGKWLRVGYSFELGGNIQISKTFNRILNSIKPRK